MELFQTYLTPLPRGFAGGIKTSWQAYLAAWWHLSDSASYLSDDGLSGLVIFVEEVVGLNKELAGVFLRLSHPLLPQQDGRIGVFVSVKLLLAAAADGGKNVDVK